MIGKLISFIVALIIGFLLGSFFAETARTIIEKIVS